MACERIRRNVTRPDPIFITVDGHPVEAYEGETVAAMLLFQGEYISGWSMFCNMGVCFACMVEIAEGPDHPFRPVPACMTPVRTGMVIRTGRTLTANHAIGAEPVI